jgi:hypothetical protein
LEINRSLIAVAAIALAGAACTGKHNRVTVQNEEQESAPRVASVVRMNDTKASAQLVSGFYAVENGSWRWTSGRFSALLRTPPGAAQNGAVLTLAFTVPDIVAKKLGSVTLRASINGMALKPETYTAAGAYEFSADVPAALLTGDSVKVDFALDRSLPPDVDKRELGIIASSVGLTGK